MEGRGRRHVTCEPIEHDRASQLVAYVRALEALQARIDELDRQRSAVYREAMACGFDRKTLKRVMARRHPSYTSFGQETLTSAEQELLEEYEQLAQGHM